MLRRLDGIEVPLDIQTFTKPITFNGEVYTLFSAMDITHELRLRYLEQIFYHGMINTAGGMSSIMSLLNDCSSRILRDVLYHRDVTAAAEQRELDINMESFEAAPYLEKLVKEECSIRNTQPSIIDVNFTCDIIYSDKRVLGHVLRNMLVNAIEASTRCSKPVSMKCEQDGEGRTVISMANCGVMPNDVQKMLFRRYVTTKGADRGMGTYVMKMMTEQYLGGEVMFTSANNVTEYKVRIPGNISE